MLRGIPWHASHRRAYRACGTTRMSTTLCCSTSRAARPTTRSCSSWSGCLRAARPTLPVGLRGASAGDSAPPQLAYPTPTRCPARKAIGTAWYLSHADAVAVPVCDAARADFLRSDWGPRGPRLAERTVAQVPLVRARGADPNLQRRRLPPPVDRPVPGGGVLQRHARRLQAAADGPSQRAAAQRVACNGAWEPCNMTCPTRSAHARAR